MRRLNWHLAAAAALALAGCGREPRNAGTVVIRIGHFPNVTHAQGVIAHGMSRQGKGWFEERLGPGVRIEWYTYNAGPSAMEAIFAGSLDLTYVGPNPALNAYMRSKGDEIRLIRGAAVGGAGLVVQGDGRIRTPADFRGKKVGTPQLGNTQDVACRAWLIANGFRVTQTGGDVLVLPTANPDQLALFQKGDLDAVWTVEPWVSRLILEAKGKLFLPEPEAITTIFVSSVKFLGTRRELARKLAAAHDELTAWMAAHPEDAQARLREELKQETGREMPAELIAAAWKNLRFTTETSLEALEKSVREAREIGFIQEPASLSRLVESP